MSSSSDDDPKLPHDVAVQILKRLPVRSLLRFRCVSWSWRSTIDDPRFVALHLSHSALDACNWHLVCDPLQDMCSLLPNASLTLPSKSQIEMPFAAPLHSYDFVGSCNGLICVTGSFIIGSDPTMYLWNLFTRKHKAIPRPAPENPILREKAACISLGFGFDVGSNDYKIVRILFCPANHRRRFGQTKCSAKIYSLNTDSSRSLECEVPALCYHEPVVFLNGNLHWLAFNREEAGCGSIISFEVIGEVFDEMALPEEISHRENGGLLGSVAVLSDLLAVFISRGEAAGHPESHSICSVWVMRDYGAPDSWTKLYTFEASGLVTGFDGFTRNGELLMEIDNRGRIIRNPITGRIALLPQSTPCALFSVVESLVSLSI